ncbi:Diphosphomevalonate decarboxylase [Hanseniaspora valbyensis NRRL Y-1626]|uniref:Diphosphomevalonate decarboxylase n=1 Tax=Hanseniaspora valbyensis NRRL Y-1626 TaxID=766949 RepID=A0A1B7T935_9ASCO|nr:Diphosphomevalonate decarboxylase [Hanseniaspora valbyensis NRRL Y-1626]
MSSTYTASITAPVNIATLKYWGKRDTSLNLPTNSSISVTLDQADLKTTTSAMASADFTKDRLWLNGEEDLQLSQSKRLTQVLSSLKEKRRLREAKDESLEKISSWFVHIVSVNNFPTAAGLASSAAGFAALVVCIAKLFELDDDMTELSKIARQGSGSACRSLFGGFVAWEMGSLADGSDSKAVEVCPLNHWPEMKACVLVACADKKDVSSTSGMQLTVKTSDLFQKRIDEVVPERFEQMKKSIHDKNFALFAELTMKDSNSFHATCLDSYPPIFYMNDTSKKIVKLVHLINAFYNETIVAYTFDAGPNAVLYYLEQNELKLMSFIYAMFKDLNGWETKYSTEELNKFISNYDSLKLQELSLDMEIVKGCTRVILTRVGPGPLTIKESLINEHGFPKN